MKEIVPYVETHYRVHTDPEHRAIAGLSMGGMQSLTIALTNPRMFRYVGGFSTGLRAKVLEEMEKSGVTKNPDIKRFKVFWLSMGKDDALLYGVNKEMMAKFD